MAKPTDPIVLPLSAIVTDKQGKIMPFADLQYTIFRVGLVFWCF